ncbi:unnamed protein product, partial [Prorocentrum cordatum]
RGGRRAGPHRRGPAARAAAGRAAGCQEGPGRHAAGGGDPVQERGVPRRGDRAHEVRAARRAGDQLLDHLVRALQGHGPKGRRAQRDLRWQSGVYQGHGRQGRQRWRPHHASRGGSHGAALSDLQERCKGGLHLRRGPRRADQAHREARGQLRGRMAACPPRSPPPGWRGDARSAAILPRAAVCSGTSLGQA